MSTNLQSEAAFVERIRERTAILLAVAHQKIADGEMERPADARESEPWLPITDAHVALMICVEELIDLEDQVSKLHAEGGAAALVDTDQRWSSPETP